MSILDWGKAYKLPSVVIAQIISGFCKFLVKAHQIQSGGESNGLKCCRSYESKLSMRSSEELPQSSLKLLDNCLSIVSASHYILVITYHDHMRIVYIHARHVKRPSD